MGAGVRADHVEFIDEEDEAAARTSSMAFFRRSTRSVAHFPRLAAGTAAAPAREPTAPSPVRARDLVSIIAA